MQHTDTHIHIHTEGAASCLGQEGGIQDILAAMRLFATNLEIVSYCCTALWSLSVIGQLHVEYDHFCNNNVEIFKISEQRVILHMHTHSDGNLGILHMHIHSDGNLGILHMHIHSDGNLGILHMHIDSDGNLGILHMHTHSDGNLGILTKEKGVVDVCKALTAHGVNSDLVDAACSALWSLSMEGV